MLLIAAGIYLFTHLGTDFGRLADHIMRAIELNPQRPFLHRIVIYLHDLHASEIKVAAGAAVVYGAIELVEGTGLWFDKLWAEYLTVISTSLLLPYEIYELAPPPDLVEGARHRSQHRDRDLPGDRAAAPAAIGARAVKFLKKLVTVFVDAGRGYAADGCSQQAAGIAYRLLFSIAPLAIVLVSIFGLVLQNDELRERVTDTIVDALPVSASGRNDVEKAIEAIATPASAAGLDLVARLRVGGHGRDGRDPARARARDGRHREPPVHARQARRPRADRGRRDPDPRHRGPDGRGQLHPEGLEHDRLLDRPARKRPLRRVDPAAHVRALDRRRAALYRFVPARGIQLPPRARGGDRDRDPPAADHAALGLHLRQDDEAQRHLRHADRRPRVPLLGVPVLVGAAARRRGCDRLGRNRRSRGRRSRWGMQVKRAILGLFVHQNEPAERPTDADRHP